MLFIFINLQIYFILFSLFEVSLFFVKIFFLQYFDDRFPDGKPEWKKGYLEMDTKESV